MSTPLESTRGARRQNAQQKKLKMTRVARGNTDISKTNSRRPRLAQPTNQAAACGTSRVASS